MKIVVYKIFLLSIIFSVAYSQHISNWTKLPSKQQSYFTSVFTAKTGLSSYYTYKKDTSQRLIKVTLSQVVGGVTKSLTFQIDLKSPNSEKQKKIEVKTNIVFQVKDPSNPLNDQKVTALNKWSKQNSFDVIFEPRAQLIIISQKLVAGGYIISFDQPTDSGILLTLLSILLLIVVLAKEILRLKNFQLIENSSHNIRTEALQILCGWYLKFIYEQSQKYLTNFDTYLANVFIFTVIIIFTIQFAYPCFSLDFSTADKFAKLFIVTIFVLTQISLNGLIIALVLQIICLLFIETTPLKPNQALIEFAYAVVLNLIFDYLFFSTENCIGYQNDQDKGILLLGFVVIQILLTFLKYKDILIGPVSKIQQLKNHFKVWSSGYIEKARNKTSQVRVKVTKKDEDRLQSAGLGSHRSNLNADNQLNQSRDT